MIVSFFPGRIRLRFDELKNPAVAGDAVARIKAIPGITGVEENSRTGSLLIKYDAKALSTEKLIEMGKAELARLNIRLDLPEQLTKGNMPT
jgi:hypothetical protein